MGLRNVFVLFCLWIISTTSSAKTEIPKVTQSKEILEEEINKDGVLNDHESVEEEEEENNEEENVSDDFVFTLPARTTIDPLTIMGEEKFTQEKGNQHATSRFTTVGAFQQRLQANKPPLLLRTSEETTRKHFVFKEEEDQESQIEYNALEDKKK